MIVVPIVLGISALFVLIFGTRQQSSHLMDYGGADTYSYPDRRTGSSQPTNHQSHLSDPSPIDRIRAETQRLVDQAPIEEQIRGPLEMTADPDADLRMAHERVDLETKINSGIYQNWFKNNNLGLSTPEQCTNGVYTEGLCFHKAAPARHAVDTPTVAAS